MIDARPFADEWIAMWNARDLDKILTHYADDIVFLSPIAERVVGNGRVEGIAALRAYWAKALSLSTELHFELEDVLVGHQCLTIVYQNHRGQRVGETVEFGADGKVVRSCGCYGGTA